MLTLQTPRLMLRDLQPEDVQSYVALQMMPEMQRYRQCYSIEGLADWQAQKMVHDGMDDQKDRTQWAMSIFTQQSKNMIGDITVTLDFNEELAGISYGLHPDFWSQGYITEALAKMTEFTHNILDIQIIREPVIAANKASWRAMEKCGYTRIGEEMISWVSHEKKDTLIYVYQSLK